MGVHIKIQIMKHLMSLLGIIALVVGVAGFIEPGYIGINRIGAAIIGGTGAIMVTIIVMGNEMIKTIKAMPEK
jgi:hypothetical protein